MQLYCSLLTIRGDSESAYPKAQDSGPSIGRIICDNYRLVNRFYGLTWRLVCGFRTIPALILAAEHVCLQLVMSVPNQAKKEASANSGGTVISALAGGGNQSFLTDGARRAWGKDSQERCIRERFYLSKLFPDPRKNINLT